MYVSNRYKLFRFNDHTARCTIETSELFACDWCKILHQINRTRGLTHFPFYFQICDALCSNASKDFFFSFHSMHFFHQKKFHLHFSVFCFCCCYPLLKFWASSFFYISMSMLFTFVSIHFQTHLIVGNKLLVCTSVIEYCNIYNVKYKCLICIIARIASSI